MKRSDRQKLATLALSVLLAAVVSGQPIPKAVEAEDCEDVEECECGSGELIGKYDRCCSICCQCFDYDDDEDN